LIVDFIYNFLFLNCNIKCNTWWWP